MKFTMKDIEQLKQKKLIRGYTAPPPRKPLQDTNGKIVARHYTRKSAEKDWMGWNLLYWANHQCVTLVEEYEFDASRKFRFDWAIPSMKIAIEYEGLMSEKSGHTTAKGYTKDTDKYNLAASQGWVVLRFTALNHKTMLQALKKFEK